MMKIGSCVSIFLLLFWGCTTSEPEEALHQPDYAQLAYQWVETTEEAVQNWTIYEEPFEPQEGGDTLLVQAHRIGYRPSGVVKRSFLALSKLRCFQGRGQLYLMGFVRRLDENMDRDISGLVGNL